MELLKAICTFIGYCVFWAMAILLIWLYLIVTPDQMSAECEWARMQLEGK